MTALARGLSLFVVASAPKRNLPIVSGAASGPASASQRRLPVLPNAEDDEGEERPPWHWAGIGTVAIFFAWLPLAALGNTLLGRLLRGAEQGVSAPSSVGLASVPMRLLLVGLNALFFAAAAFAGGVLVGRFGGRAGRREALASGVCAALVAWLLTLAQSVSAGALGWLLLLLVIAALGAGAAYLGGSYGLRRRPGVR